LQSLSPGAWVILALALLSSVLIAMQRMEEKAPFTFWVFHYGHVSTYQPVIDRWNEQHPDAQVDMVHLHLIAMERRLLSGFMAGTPVADLIEVERRVAARAFMGPDELIGFYDLTDRLRAEGLLESFNRPSLSPWMKHGKIYGIPHDVHPVLLAYRWDIIEAAGIDITGVETWRELFETLRPLMQDFDGDGRPDRYILGGWPAFQAFVEAMIRQAGGAFFTPDGEIVFASERNARTLAEVVSWCVGPDRVCTDARDSTVSGHRQRLEGTVLCSIIPDWQVSVWRNENPGMSGKVKLMPLPAFEPGGRRTSVWGGTMLGITKSTRDFETAWQLARELYVSREVAEITFRGTGIIPPNRDFWDMPVFDEPEPYFAGQPVGRLFIEQAPYVPERSSSPFEQMAMEKMSSVAVLLQGYAERERKYSAEELLPEARRLLRRAEDEIRSHMARTLSFENL